MNTCRRLSFLLSLLMVTWLVGACGGGGGDPAGEPLIFPGLVTSGFDGDLDWEHPSGGDGGAGAGADGGGGVGAAGDFGQFRRALAIVKRGDGTELGRAETDPVKGMITIRPGAYEGPLLVEFHGQPGAEYFDEGRNAYVPFPPGLVARVWVPKIVRNIGVTPFTEAAYRYLTEGDTAERGGALPTAEQIRVANERVRSELNRLFPASLQVDDITRLPFVVNDATGPGSVSTTKRGVYGLVSSTLSKQAAMYNPDSAAPTLDALAQLSQDLLDGRLDGHRSGQPLGAAAARAYDAATLVTELSSALAELGFRYGDTLAQGALPVVVGYGSTRYDTYFFDASIRPDGQAYTIVKAWEQNLKNRQLGDLDRLAAQAPRVFTVYGNMGSGALFIKVSTPTSAPQYYAIGDNPNGELGDGTRNQTNEAVPIALPGQPTHFAGGFGHTVARFADGSVWAWGDNAYGQLGQGVIGSTLLRSPTPLRVTLPAGAVAVAASNTASYALLEDGRVFSWGASWGFGLLGDGTKDGQRLTPAPVVSAAGALGSVVAIGARDNDAFAVAADGSVWTWGSFPTDAAGGTSGGRAVATRVDGLPSAPRVRKVLTEQGLFAALLEDGSVYSWGVHFDQTAGRVLRDLVPRRVLNLPPLRDLMPGGFLGYSERPSDRVTGMGIDFNGNQWRVRGRVGERFDPDNPLASRRPPGTRPEDCTVCHGVLPQWPITPPAVPANAPVCAPPLSIHSNLSTGVSFITQATQCELCHNNGFQVFLTCQRPPNLPPARVLQEPPLPTAECVLPAGHVTTPVGTSCSSCHNSVIAAPLSCLPPAITTPVSKTAAIVSVSDDVPALTGPVANGGATNDTAPALAGTISAALSAGESVQVLRNGVTVGTATVSGTGWTFADRGLASGTQSYTVRVATASARGFASATWSIVVDTAPPAQTVAIVSVTDDVLPAMGIVPNGGATNDTAPTLAGTLSAPLAAGEVLQVLRNGAVIGNASVSALAWSFNDGSLAPGQHVYGARIVDAAGNVGTAAPAYTITLSTSTAPQSIAVTAVSDDVPPVTGAIANGGSTDDTSPTVSGTLAVALGAGERVQVLRNGAPVGFATVSGLTFTFTDAGLGGNATYTYVARVLDAASASVAVSGAHTLFVTSVGVSQQVTIVSVRDDVEPATGLVPNGGSTNDPTPTLSGTLSAGLAAGESVQVLRNGAPAGTATVSGTGWTFTDTPQPGGTAAYTARVVNTSGQSGTASATYTVTLTSSGPMQSVTIVSVTDDFGPVTGALLNGGSTDDSTPTLAGTVSAALSAGQSVRILRNGTEVGTAVVSGSGWTFQDAGLATGTSYTYVARVVDASGIPGTPSGGFTFTLTTGLPQTTTIVAIVDDVAPVTGSVPSGGGTNDTAPVLSGTISGALQPGQRVAVYRGGTEIGTATMSASTANSAPTWTYADSGLAAGTHVYTARVVDTQQQAGAMSAPYTITVDLIVPTQTVTITATLSSVQPTARSPVPSGQAMSDPQATIQMTVSAPPAADESVRVFRDGQDIGAASFNANAGRWQLRDPQAQTLDGVPRAYTARVVDAAGNAGPASAPWPVTYNLALCEPYWTLSTSAGLPNRLLGVQDHSGFVGETAGYCSGCHAVTGTSVTVPPGDPPPGNPYRAWQYVCRRP
ncbi:MAG TPA: Ig-like domain-containing protein [Quisquiliibacterium sp.]|nr:Ig-like domain-containing protein [Quisquiliibacterium sp.]